MDAGDHVPEATGPEKVGAGQARSDVETAAASGGLASGNDASGHGASDEADSRQSTESGGTPGTKGDVIQALLKREYGATLDELTAATGWQAHSVRGFLAGTLKKKLGCTVASERGEDGVRRYRIPA